MRYSKMRGLRIEVNLKNKALFNPAQPCGTDNPILRRTIIQTKYSQNSINERAGDDHGMYSGT